MLSTEMCKPESVVPKEWECCGTLGWVRFLLATPRVRAAQPGVISWDTWLASPSFRGSVMNVTKEIRCSSYPQLVCVISPVRSPT